MVPVGKNKGPFSCGAMIKFHGIALDEPGRRTAAGRHEVSRGPFLPEFEEDMATFDGPSSPVSGSRILLRPSLRA